MSNSIGVYFLFTGNISNYVVHVIGKVSPEGTGPWTTQTEHKEFSSDQQIVTYKINI